FDTWYLDCSPSCRADPDMDCDSDAFAKDPEAFVQQAYVPCVGDDVDNEEKTCTAEDLESVHEIPNFVVCNASDLKRIRGTLEHTMGLSKVQKFTHGINGLRVGELLTVGSDNMANNDFSKVTLLGGALEFSLDEIVLYQKMN
ncbi:MAG: hypothetical protein SGILL_010110, partial [Bacillariaceae sp.]